MNIGQNIELRQRDTIFGIGPTVRIETNIDVRNLALYSWFV